MANDQSNGGPAGTPESLKAERENLEATIASMRQMARDFNVMARQSKSFDAERVADYLQLTGPDMRDRVWAGIRSPEGFQWHKEWMARKQAKVEQVLAHLAAFTQAVILWAEDLERRESRYLNISPALAFQAPSGLSNEISAPIVKGGATEVETPSGLSNEISAPVIEGGAVDVEATGSVLTGASALSAAAAGIVVTAAGVVIYGAYKGAVEPGLKTAANASKVRQAQLAREVYDIDHDPDYENTPQKGWILYTGECRWHDGTIRLSNGQIAVDASGNSVRSDEERQAIARAFTQPTGATTWQEYQTAINNLYGGQATFSSRKFQTMVNGKITYWSADNVIRINESSVAIEAKFVDDWSSSIYNPLSAVASKSFATEERDRILSQARAYSSTFLEVTYHTNSPHFAQYYGDLFKKANLTNIRFIITK